MDESPVHTADEQLAAHKQLAELALSCATRCGFTVAEITDISTLSPASPQRATYKLTLPDKTDIKAQVFQQSETARRVATLAELLDPSWAPRILGQNERVLLMQWIEGCVILERHFPLRLLREVAVLQAKLHAVVVSKRLASAALSMLQWQALYADWLNSLVEFDKLSPARREYLIDEAAVAPETQRLVIAHGDLCGENLVRQNNGALYLIDYGTLNITPVEFDLVRTCYRSGFDDTEQARYLDCYRNAVTVGTFDTDSVRWWQPLVWAQSAQFRLRAEVPGWERALSLLTQC